VPKLNQINAVVSGRKGEAEKAVTELYKLIQKDQLTSYAVERDRACAGPVVPVTSAA
jgi:hypothetical protein